MIGVFRQVFVSSQTGLKGISVPCCRTFNGSVKPGLATAHSLLQDNSTVAKLKAQNFALALRDTISWPTHLLSQILHIPEVDVISAGLAYPLLSLRYSIPHAVAYIPQMNAPVSPMMVSPVLTASQFCMTSYLQDCSTGYNRRDSRLQPV